MKQEGDFGVGPRTPRMPSLPLSPESPTTPFPNETQPHPSRRKSKVSAEHTLNRVRENQRRHRARRRDYIATLEQQLAETEQQLARARAEIERLRAERETWRNREARETAPELQDAIEVDGSVISPSSGHREGWIGCREAMSEIKLTGRTTLVSPRLTPTSEHHDGYQIQHQTSQEQQEYPALTIPWPETQSGLAPLTTLYALPTPPTGFPISYEEALEEPSQLPIEPLLLLDSRPGSPSGSVSTSTHTSHPYSPPPCCTDTPFSPTSSSSTSPLRPSTGPECTTCATRPAPGENESTTLCSQAYVLIQQQNFRGIDATTIRSWLYQGYRRAQSAGEGCSVENGALMSLLDFISGV
ncbi:hypothetical protein K469DRAFT_726386 [Zopfia rhizophila CBS 207.26]|uniref:BZIP domain-containing protein n=1 Tax=Zopfia rhizophila CBS 207.26 TaxID=1314779 RepID=A0A6A6E5E4_9PEZI|nr:hypothetical protein K469DRAFT_726386 [Zopfia rhizophila CBS 207.26]